MNPFQVVQEAASRHAQQNIARRQEQRDMSAIDQILGNAAAMQDQGAIDDAIGQILSRVSPERQAGAVAALQRRGERISATQKALAERQALEEAGVPPELANLPPDIRKRMLDQQAKEQEQTQGAEGALGVVERMRALRGTGHLGPKISQAGGLGFLSGKVRADRAEYEQLGKSLISFASNIPIRNQAEFNTLAEKLFDPTITDAAAEGLLSAMERIIRNSLPTGAKSEMPAQEAPKASLKDIWG